MRRFLAIVLFALMPLQFSWAAVASYCEHETQAGAGHIGHHEHEHHADAAVDADADAVAVATADASADGDKALGAVDLDCGHCHGHCNVMLTLTMGLPGTLAAAPRCASADGSSGAHAPSRPERPQWLPLA